MAAAYSATDTRNANWRRDLAAAETTYAVGSSARLVGEAGQGYERAIAILRPSSRRRRISRYGSATSHAELGRGLTYLERGELDAAAARADTVERVLAPLLARGNYREAMRRAADGRLLAADVVASRGNAQLARQLREAALALVVSGQEANPEKRLLAVQARALLALNGTAEARPIVERLTSLGYRHSTLIRLAQQNGLKF